MMLDELLSEYRRVRPWQLQRLRRLLKRKRSFRSFDKKMPQRIAETSGVDELALELVRYFWLAHRHYVDDHGTIAYYPGLPSIYGARNDGIEGVTRLLPFWSAYLTSPEKCDDGLKDEMKRTIRNALVHGADRSHPGYWGDMFDRSPLICEAADVALACWMLKDGLWKELNSKEQGTILAWLAQAIGKKTADNNWHLFVVLIDLVLASLDGSHKYSSEARYLRVKEFYLGDGCFSDGPNGDVDYYNAWAFHYTLFWIQSVSPDFDAEFIRDAATRFSAWYQYLFTPEGLPLFGRSLCYRMATPAPLMSAVALGCKVDKSIARTALTAVWKYFVAKGGVKLGRPTQGVFADDARWLDGYSGPASCFWSIRSLIVYYYTARKIDWQHVAPCALPAMSGKHHIEILSGRLVIHAEHGEVQVRIGDRQSDLLSNKIESQTIRQKLRQLVDAKACRPSNNLLRRGVRNFSSRLGDYE